MRSSLHRGFRGQDAPTRAAFKRLALPLSVALLSLAAPASAHEGGHGPVVRDPDAPVRVVVFGDSLAAGYGLLPAEGFSARLQDWADANYDREIVIENAGVSGDTTAGGLARLDWTLGADLPDAVLLELGANDFLRGVDPAISRTNLTVMVDRLRAADIEVLLAGMLAPRNMGDEYVRAFEAIYTDLAARYDIVFEPFFLEGVAGVPSLNQADGIHPNADGVDRMIEHIAPSMRALIDRIGR